MGNLLTDDMDIRDTELSIDFGGNGDYYLCLKETKRGKVVKLDTRIAMSGGNATTEVKLAIAKLYEALQGQTSHKESSGLRLQNVKCFNLTPVEIDTPIAYESSEMWDGKRSNLVLAKSCLDEYHVARLYSGFMDGHEFNDWCDKNDCQINDVIVGWVKLPE